MGWTTGLEPATSRVTSWCSNQLRYAHSSGRRIRTFNFLIQSQAFCQLNYPRMVPHRWGRIRTVRRERTGTSCCCSPRPVRGEQRVPCVQIAETFDSDRGISAENGSTQPVVPVGDRPNPDVETDLHEDRVFPSVVCQPLYSPQMLVRSGVSFHWGGHG